MTFHLPATYYDPPDPGPMVDCPECGGGGILYGEEPQGWWHGSGVNIPEFTCSSCDGTGEVPGVEHPDWCDLCGLSGNCPECDVPGPRDVDL